MRIDQPPSAINGTGDQRSSTIDDQPDFIEQRSPSLNDLVSVPIEQEMNIDDEDAMVNDHFLNLLCYDNDDDDVDGDSVEGWSASENEYVKDVEDEDYEDEGVVYPCYDPNMDWKLAKPIDVMKFESPAQLKDMLIDYGVANGHQLVFPVNDNNRLLVRCGKGETIDDGSEKKKESVELSV